LMVQGVSGRVQNLELPAAKRKALTFGGGNHPGTLDGQQVAI
jgi:hypothetical protein